MCSSEYLSKLVMRDVYTSDTRKSLRAKNEELRCVLKMEPKNERINLSTGQTSLVRWVTFIYTPDARRGQKVSWW